MEKIRSSPLSSLFPWLSPLVIKFAVVNGGIEVQLYRNDRLLKNWHPSELRHVLPEPLTKWIDDNHIYMGPQPYPLIKQLWQYLIPLASKKLIIDSSVLAELEEVSQPQDFALVWVLNRSLVCIEGRYEGADRYLGMGWFQKGTKIWSLNNHPSNATDSQLKNLIVPIQQADFLLNSIIPYLQHYLPTRADFQLITNFALQVIVPDARSRGLILALQSNYPQFLPTIQVPLQKIDVLLANQAIIQFPHQALTPVIIQLLQSRSSITIQGAGLPLFITEQLPIMRHYRQISDDMVAKITQSNPIVSIATLRPTLSFVHSYENGVGKYTTTATYQYQQHTLDMDALLAARQQNQRFVQQHAVWFEWPYNSNGLVNTIQQQRAPQVLLPEEVMGFDTRRVAFLHKQPSAYTIQPDGTTPVERGQSVLAQLRHHGIPGGIVGEPGGLVTMFVNACERLLRDNPQARILWLVPSHKKGSVTRAINGSTINNYVTVASLVTLRNEPALISHSWTLVIFQGLDQLLNESAQSWMLSQLKWKWTLTSVTSKHALSPSIMRVLHLPEQYHGQFCARYLFDLERSYNSAVIGQRISGLNTVQPTAPIAPKQEADRIPQTLPQKPVEPVLPKIEVSRPKVLEPILATKPSVQLSNPIDESEQETQKILSLTTQGKIVQKPRESLIQTLHSMIQINLETEPAALPSATHTPAQSAPENVRANQVVLPPDTHMLAKPVALPPNTYAPVKPAFNADGPNPAPLQPTIHIPARPASENIRSKLAPSPVHRTIELNQKKIARLHEESEQLQERLTVEDEEQSQFISMPAPLAPTVQPHPEAKREPEQPSVQHIIDTRKPSEQIRKEPEISPHLLNPQTKQELEQPHVKYSANTQASFEQLASSPLIASNTNPGVTQEHANVLPESTKPIVGITRESDKAVAENIKPISVIPQEPAKTVAERIESTSEPTLQFAVSLNLEAISKLQEESAHLQERLVFEIEEDQPEQPGPMSEPEVAPATSVVREATEPGPDVDEDWQIILQQWQPEHWEIITYLYQGQSAQLTTVERKVHRPVSKLIDEINSPVVEQLEDLLVDPDTQTISTHLHVIAGSMVDWYFSSKGR